MTVLKGINRQSNNLRFSPVFECYVNAVESREKGVQRISTLVKVQFLCNITSKIPKSFLLILFDPKLTNTKKESS